MSYPGGKNGSGVYQRIINLMPPHQVYIEPFLGGGAVLRMKRPAALSIGVDRLKLLASSFLTSDVPIVTSGDSGSAIGKSSDATRLKIVVGCGIEFLERYAFTGHELVYCDPPYLLSTRSSGRRYRFELTDVDHRRLLRCIRKIPAPVLISGYQSKMYMDALRSWNLIRFDAMTRGGLREECLWFNFPEPIELHDYRYLGQTFRERERIKRKKLRWVERLKRMPMLEKRALLSAIADSAETSDARSAIARNGERIQESAP